MSKVIFDKEAITQLLEGVSHLNDAVKSTMGPMGRNVIIDQEHDYPLMTKDGVTVARSIFLDGIPGVGIRMIKEVSEKTDASSGDGTTTATVLAHAILKEGINEILVNNRDPLQLKKGIDSAVKYIVDYKLTNASKTDVTKEDLLNIASISANNNTEIGKLVAEAYENAGESGVVTVEDSNTHETTVKVINGMQFDRGYSSVYFAPNDVVEMKNAFLLIYTGKIGAMDDLETLLSSVQRGGKSIVIIAEDVTGQALSSLVTNRMRGTLDVCTVKAPGFGDERLELLQDIAVATGATVCSHPSEFAPGVLGICDSISIGRHSTTIVGGHGLDMAVNKRAETIRQKLAQSEEAVVTKKLENRLAKLTGGVSVIYVGANSEVERKEKKDRVIDASHAVRSAQEEGILPGGGFQLFVESHDLSKGVYTGEKTETEMLGYKIVEKALKAPLQTIVTNAGYNADIVMHEIDRNGYLQGFDAKTGKYCNLMTAGIVDPTKVTRNALINAASVAGMILTTSCVIKNN